MVNSTLKPSKGSKRAHFVAFLDHHRPLDADETFGRILLLDAADWIRNTKGQRCRP